MKKILNYTQLKPIYYAIFNSTNTYGIVGWGAVYKTYLKKLQKLQNRVLKIINPENNDIFLNIKQTFHYSCIKKEYPSLKKILDSKDKKNSRTLIIPLPKHKKAIANKDFYYNSIKIFNIMPKKLKKHDKFTNYYKMKLKEWLVTIDKLHITKILYIDYIIFFFCIYRCRQILLIFKFTKLINAKTL